MTVLYSIRSQKAFDSCCPELQKILLYIKIDLGIDHTVLCGHREEEIQNSLYYASPPKTKVKWPDSNHNILPSDAVDAVPYVKLPNRYGGIHWHDKNKIIRESYLREMVRFASIFQMVALLKFDIETRWGGDWDRDWSLIDNVFNDYPHHEVIR